MNACLSCEIYGNSFLKKMLALHREIGITNLNVLRYLTACSSQPIERTKHCTHQPSSSETYYFMLFHCFMKTRISRLCRNVASLWNCYLGFFFLFLSFCVFPSKQINQHYARRYTRPHIYNNINFTTKMYQVHSSFFLKLMFTKLIFY